MTRSCRRRWLAAIAAVGALARPALPGARAAPSDPAPPRLRVLLVVAQPDDPFASRVRAELAAMGLSVLTLESWRTGEPVRTLEGAARAAGAIAAVRTVGSRKGVEIWMADQLTGRPLLRQLVIDESPGGPDQTLVALQTAELLRTSVLGLSPPPPPPAPPSPAEPPTPPPVVVAAPAPGEPAPERAVDIGAGGLYSPGGAGAAAQVWISLRQMLARRAGVAVDLSAPLRSATLSGPEGSTTVATYLAGAALIGRVVFPSAAFVADAGLGAGVVRIGLEGRAAPPLVGRSDAIVTAAGYARADLAVNVTRWLRIGARAVGGVAARRATIQFAGNDAGAWGRTFVGAFALAELCWR